MSSNNETNIPVANVQSAQKVRSNRYVTRLWWLTAICLVVAAGLVITSFQSQGTEIAVTFEDGHGLKPGDTLRYRGIEVGTVNSVKIASDLDSVQVRVLLEPGNESLAVEGSQFWIERARLRLGQISGLDTVLGAKYLLVLPGDPKGKRVYEFAGLDSPLNIARADSKDIRIQFPAGEGLQVGDTIQYRGISVGEVTYVDLSEDISSVWVGARLVGSARALARQGTQFWIERPRLALTEIRGLETLLGGRYIAIEPSIAESPAASEFVGLPEPPPLPRRDGSLEIELDSPNRLGLVRGAPITYRGLEVGSVSNVDLSNDGASVKIRAVIDPEYTDLVRFNSRFWPVSGLEIEAGFQKGVKISVDSVSSWLRGGIAFATPDTPGQHVVTGHRFMLERPKEEWLEWEPRIAIGREHAIGKEFPSPIRVVASWRASLLGLYGRRTTECWGIALGDGRLHVPTKFIEDAKEAKAEVMIEVAGESFPFDENDVETHDSISSILIPYQFQITKWPKERTSKVWRETDVLLIINPEQSEPVALDGTRLAVLEKAGLKIAPGVPIASSLNGSPVVSSDTGALIGLLLETKEGWIIGFIQ